MVDSKDSGISNTEKPYRYIAVEGLIGAGKTEITEKIASTLNFTTILEDTTNNPFIGAFFKHSPSEALASHLYFLLHHSKQSSFLSTHRHENTPVISDFIVDKYHFLAEQFLTSDEFSLYESIFRRITFQTPTPDLTLYLQVPTPIVRNHLMDHPYAKVDSFNLNFLEQVNDAYQQFFHYYDRAPLLIVNAEHIDLLNDSQAFDALIEHLATTQSGRHYFNPSI